MKKIISILFTISIFNLFSQETPEIEKKKDSILKTETVEVITSYAPKISDAFKIKQKPTISLSRNTEKKALEYTIKSAPVASTFVPTSGAMKPLELEDRERIYKNYFILGLGNHFTPLLEGYIHENTSNYSEYSIYLKGIYTSNPIKDIQLNSTFYNLDFAFDLQKQERNFDWKTTFKASQDQYNYYGLPTKLKYNNDITKKIDEEQVYTDLELNGNIMLYKRYIDGMEGKINYFYDNFSRNEIDLKLKSDFSLSLNDINKNLNDLKIIVDGNYLQSNLEEQKQKIARLGINPFYNISYNELEIHVGAKAIYSKTNSNIKKQFFFYPDIKGTYSFSKKFKIYLGAVGNLVANSYEKFSEENNFTSPEVKLIQTDNKHNFFTGIKGNITNTISYNAKATYLYEENKPFFVETNSKYREPSIENSFTEISLKGYQYGNSFDVVYDDVKTATGSLQLEYDSKKATFGIQGTYSKFGLTNEKYAWNTPKIEGSIFGLYKQKKWNTSVNLFYVGSRNAIELNEENIKTPILLDGYLDINLNGNYHINPFVSVFLKANNLTNGYRKYTNYNTQGYQIIAGVVWKFGDI